MKTLSRCFEKLILLSFVHAITIYTGWFYSCIYGNSYLVLCITGFIYFNLLCSVYKQTYKNTIAHDTMHPHARGDNHYVVYIIRQYNFSHLYYLSQANKKEISVPKFWYRRCSMLPADFMTTNHLGFEKSSKFQIIQSPSQSIACNHAHLFGYWIMALNKPSFHC